MYLNLLLRRKEGKWGRTPVSVMYNGWIRLLECVPIFTHFHVVLPAQHSTTEPGPRFGFFKDPTLSIQSGRIAEAICGYARSRDNLIRSVFRNDDVTTKAEGGGFGRHSLENDLIDCPVRLVRFAIDIHDQDALLLDIVCADRRDVGDTDRLEQA
jgi:hypothetical protein